MHPRLSAFCAALFSAFTLSMAWADEAATVTGIPVTIDVRRSLAVTEQPILAHFSLKRIMDQLIAQSGVQGQTSLELFHQWWDTQNPKPGLGLGRNCDTETDALGNPVLNSFPYDCRPATAGQEGQEAASDPFDPTETNQGYYFAVGLFNRFDLAPANGANCGEYRIVFGRRSGIELFRNRNLFIFEAMMPNPQPALGLNGCRRIVQFWADLSRISDMETRARKLEAFYFNGVNGLPPVVHIDHYGNVQQGAVRTNQFLEQQSFDNGLNRIWNLREFKLRKVRSNNRWMLKFVPMPVQETPFGGLFAPTSTHPRAAAFLKYFPTQVKALAADSIAKIDIYMPDYFDAAQSLSLNGIVDDYAAQLGSGPSALRSAIEAQLVAIGSTLTADNIVKRAQALSCAGCHQLNSNVDIGGGLIWPESLPSPPPTATGFVHVSERLTETVDGVTRYLISPALLNEFLPSRKKIMEDFLSDRLRPGGKPEDPIGGRRVH
jgi:hypothetical protein